MDKRSKKPRFFSYWQGCQKQAQALLFELTGENFNFKASNGWLNKFQKRHQWSVRRSQLEELLKMDIDDIDLGLLEKKKESLVNVTVQEDDNTDWYEDDFLARIQDPLNPYAY